MSVIIQPRPVRQPTHQRPPARWHALGSSAGSAVPCFPRSPPQSLPWSLPVCPWTHDYNGHHKAPPAHLYFLKHGVNALLNELSEPEMSPWRYLHCTKSQTSNRMSCDVKQSNRKQSPKVAVWYPKGWERVTNCDCLSQSCLWSQRSIHVFINYHQQMCIWAIITLWSLLNDWEDKAVGGGGRCGGGGGGGVMTGYFATGIYLQKWTSIRNWKGYSLLNVMLLWIQKVNSLVHLFQRSTSTPRLFHRLKIGRFSGSLAELFLVPPHSCSVSGI